MTVTAKEEREIIAECREAAETTPTSADEGAADAESADVRNDDRPPTALTVSDVKNVVVDCLDEKLPALDEAVRSTNELAATAAADIKKVLDIYNVMTECRNKATLLLTKHIEMYERLKALAVFCHDQLIGGETQSAFEKSLLARTANIERVALRTLGSFGVLPVWPDRNDAFDEHLHQIISEIKPTRPDDIPGAIAECLKMGVMRDGVVAKAAEVVVFGNQPESSPETAG